MKRQKVLYLTCTPHFVHKTFAKSINSKKVVINQKIIYFLRKFKLERLVFLISFLYGLFLKVEEDILFVEGTISLFCVPILKFKNRHLKVIYLDGDLTLQEIFKKKRHKVMDFYFKFVDGIISLSERNKFFAEQVVNVPIEVCFPFPVNFKRVNVVRKNYGLYVGRLAKEKNVQRILEFVKQSKDIEKLLVVGSGPLEKEVFNASKNSKIEYLGHKKNVSKYYFMCKFLLHLTDKDSFPCTVLEATKCGCYPLISEKIGNSNLFDKRFVIKDINNNEEINNKIKFILNNEKSSNFFLGKSSKRILIEKEAVELFKVKFDKLIKKIK